MRRPSALPPAATPRAPGSPAERDAAKATEAAPGPDAARDAAKAPKSDPGTAVLDVSRVLGDDRAGAPAPLPGMEPGAGGTDVPSEPIRLRDVWRASRARRKALRAEVRRFTVRQRRRRMVWIGSAASLVLLVLVTLGAAYSPLFAVEKITIVGTSQLDTAAVEEALSGQLGTPLPLVDESAIKAVLIGFPLVETYSLEARPPHDLVVRIVERTPIGVLPGRAGYTLVDAAGVALSTTPEPPAGHAILTIADGVGSPTFASVGRVMRALPESIRAQVTEVTATTPDDVTLTLGGTNTQVVWGSADESAEKANVLETMMAARPPASVSVYDVSSPNAIVVR